MGEHNAGAAMRGCVCDDVSQWKGGASFVAIVAGNVDALRTIVDVGDPQALASGIAFREAAREEGPGGGWAVDLQRDFGTLIPHAQQSTDGPRLRLTEASQEWG